MNQAQLNKRIVDDALKNNQEARLAREAVVAKVATWFPDGGYEPWADECFKRLWISYHNSNGVVSGFKDVLCGVLWKRFPGHSSRGDWVLPSLRREYLGASLNVWLPLEPRRFCSSRTDDEFEELIEDWCDAVRRARGIENPVPDMFIGKWIIDRFDKLNWHDRDNLYWRVVFHGAEKEACLPPRNISYGSARRKKWTWPMFHFVIVDMINPTERQIPRGWDDDTNPPKTIGGWIKRVRYLVRIVKDAPGAARGNDPIADYGSLIGREINGAMMVLRRDIGDPCMDNWRFAALDKPGDVRRYRARRATGCCGFADKKVTIHGRKFIIGCNYGH